DESYALALEDAKKLDEALAALSKIPGHESSSRLSWHRGRILVALERRDEAREVLNSVVTRGDGSFEANLAKAMLARLDVAKGAAAPAVPKDDAAVPKVEPTQENAATGSAGEP